MPCHDGSGQRAIHGRSESFHQPALIDKAHPQRPIRVHGPRPTKGIDRRFNHLDTTSFALTGEYVPDRDEHAIHITHGYSKDHRPDLKQVVLELMVSQDGGVPFVSKSWDGNTSDTQVFQQRAEALMRAFKDTPRPRYLVADAKLYCETHAAHLIQLGFITRIPATLKL